VGTDVIGGIDVLGVGEPVGDVVGAFVGVFVGVELLGAPVPGCSLGVLGALVGVFVGVEVGAFVSENPNSPIVPPVAVSRRFSASSRMIESSFKALIVASMSTTIGIPVDEKPLKVAPITAVVSLRICCKKRRFLP